MTVGKDACPYETDRKPRHVDIHPKEIQRVLLALAAASDVIRQDPVYARQTNWAMTEGLTPMPHDLNAMRLQPQEAVRPHAIKPPH